MRGAGLVRKLLTASVLVGMAVALAGCIAAPPPATSCDPAYPDVCIAPPPPDLDCPEIAFRNFRALPSDPHGFDADHDGIGCEATVTTTTMTTSTTTTTTPRPDCTITVTGTSTFSYGPACQGSALVGYFYKCAPNTDLPATLPSGRVITGCPENVGSMSFNIPAGSGTMAVPGTLPNDTNCVSIVAITGDARDSTDHNACNS